MKGTTENLEERNPTNLLIKSIRLKASVDEIMEIVDKNSIDINSNLDQGGTIAHLAVSRDHIGLLNFLISKENIHFNGQDDQGNTPLHLAVDYGKRGMVSLLLKVSDPFIRNMNGNSVVDFAATSGDDTLVTIFLVH